MTGSARFPTAVGVVGIAWRDDVVTAVRLPPAPARPDEGEPPAAIRAVVDRIQRLLDGTPDDLSDVAVDLSGLAGFPRRVYELVRTIPPGAYLTYGEVAERLGEPGGAQAVGQAMGHNPVPIVVPCHRVVAADGRLGGFSAPGGAETKRRMLAIEGAALPAAQPVLFE